MEVVKQPAMPPSNEDTGSMISCASLPLTQDLRLCTWYVKSTKASEWYAAELRKSLHGFVAKHRTVRNLLGFSMMDSKVSFEFFA